MENFTPFSALIGGLFIGAASVLLLLATGRIAGISGIAGQILPYKASETPWRLAFVIGLVAAPIAVYLLSSGMYLFTGTAPSLSPTITFQASPWLLALAGLLVGFGTRLGSGCTSGHGICGMARLSKRSLAATLTFILFGVATLYVARHIFTVL